jgi:hypothetical protein
MFKDSYEILRRTSPELNNVEMIAMAFPRVLAENISGLVGVSDKATVPVTPQAFLLTIEIVATFPLMSKSLAPFFNSLYPFCVETLAVRSKVFTGVICDELLELHKARLPDKVFKLQSLYTLGLAQGKTLIAEPRMNE